MTSSFRFHQLSQTEASWVSSTLDAVQFLLSAAQDRRASETIHHAISSGPLWSSPLRQRLGTIRQMRPICELLVQRTNALSPSEPYCVVILSVISHFITTIGCMDSPSSEEVMKAMQRVIDQVATTSSASVSGSIDHLYAIGLSALIRVGRTIGSSTRGRLGQTYDLLGWSTTCQHGELRREIVSIFLGVYHNE